MSLKAKSISWETPLKSFEHLKNLKTGRVSYLGLGLTIYKYTCHQKPNPSRETALLKSFEQLKNFNPGPQFRPRTNHLHVIKKAKSISWDSPFNWNLTRVYVYLASPAVSLNMSRTVGKTRWKIWTTVETMSSRTMAPRPHVIRLCESTPNPGLVPTLTEALVSVWRGERKKPAKLIENLLVPA